MAIDATRVSGSRRFAMGAGIVVIATGIVVLLGWFLRIEFLKSIVPGLSTMKANTALAFVFSGTSLLFTAKDRVPAVRRTLAIAVGALAVATALQDVTGRPSGIDHLLVRDTALPVTPGMPGRMGLNTAAAFVTAACALLLANGRRPASRVAAQLAAILTAAIGAVGVIGYAYSGDPLHGIASYTQMAIHTAWSFVFLGAGVALLHPDEGVVGIVTSSGPGSMLTKRLLPAVFLAPFLIGWLRLQGEHAGLYATEFGVAILIVTIPTVLAAFLLICARRIDRLDSARRAAEREVRAGTERTRIALDAGRMAIWELDLNTNRVTWSDRMLGLFGIAPDQAPADPGAFFRLIHPDDRPEIEAAVRQAIAGEPDLEFECRTVWPDGSTHWIYARAEAMREEDGRPSRMTGVASDITDRKLLEVQLRQAQKLEAVGQLAGGVAHDFNNVLTAIIGYSDIVLSDMSGNTPGRSDIEEIRKAGVRASAITQQLLAFSRRQILQPRVIDINRLVESLQTMLRRLLPEHIALLLQLDPRIGSVKADPTQVEQILVNLAVNARDAMPQGGRLIFETANVSLDENRQQALELARSHEGRIDLLLSDVVMPGSGSVLLFEELAREHEDVKVLYMSGYADETVVRQGLLIEGVPFLQKPFSSKALADKVREVLDRSAA